MIRRFCNLCDSEIKGDIRTNTTNDKIWQLEIHTVNNENDVYHHTDSRVYFGNRLIDSNVNEDMVCRPCITEILVVIQRMKERVLNKVDTVLD